MEKRNLIDIEIDNILNLFFHKEINVENFRKRIKELFTNLIPKENPLFTRESILDLEDFIHFFNLHYTKDTSSGRYVSLYPLNYPNSTMSEIYDIWWKIQEEKETKIKLEEILGELYKENIDFIQAKEKILVLFQGEVNLKDSNSILNTQHIHPGEILWMEFLKKSSTALKSLVKQSDFSEKDWLSLIRGEIPLTNPMASDLGLYFGNGTEFWLNLRNNHRINYEK